MVQVRQWGLTGGIGSGKSTVASALEAQGFTVIDADQLSRAATAANGSAMPDIQKYFGDDFVTSDGALDRAKMRHLVFQDPSARARLQSIVHLRVIREIALAAHQAYAQGQRNVIIDIPLLVESGHWRKNLHKVIVVDCSTESQIQRVMERNGFCRKEVESIIAAQASREQRLRAADIVISNEGVDINQLREKARKIGLQVGL